MAQISVQNAYWEQYANTRECDIIPLEVKRKLVLEWAEKQVQPAGQSTTQKPMNGSC